MFWFQSPAEDGVESASAVNADKIELEMQTSGEQADVADNDDNDIKDKTDELEVKKSVLSNISNAHLPYMAKYFEAIVFRALPDSMWVNVENIPTRWAHIFAVLNFVVFWLTTIYYFVQSYNTEIQSSYVSTNPNSGVCHDNYLQVDLNMLVSVNNGSRGIWSTLPDYQLNTTAYSFKFAGYSGIVMYIFTDSFIEKVLIAFVKGNDSFFESQLQIVERKLQMRTERAKNRGLAWHYILWGSYIHDITVENLNSHRHSH